MRSISFAKVIFFT